MRREANLAKVDESSMICWKSHFTIGERGNLFHDSNLEVLIHQYVNAMTFSTENHHVGTFSKRVDETSFFGASGLYMIVIFAQLLSGLYIVFLKSIFLSYSKRYV